MFRSLVVLALVLLFVKPGSAQEAEEQAAPNGEVTDRGTVPSAPDVVILKNGDRYRGTIAELVNGRHVTIVLITGETRKFEHGDIEYAGPAGEAPQDAEPPAPAAEPDGDVPRKKAAAVESGRHKVRLTSNLKGVQFYARADSEQKYRRLCSAPCTRTLDENTYQIAARTHPNRPNLVAGRVMLDDDAKIGLHMRSRAGVRRAGVIVFIPSLAVLGLGVLYGAAAARHELPIVYTAVGMGAVGVVVGLALLVTSDRYELRIAPLRQSP